MAQIKKVILKDTMSGDQLFPATSIDMLYNTDGTKWTPPTIPSPLNADQLQGHEASYFGTATQYTELSSKYDQLFQSVSNGKSLIASAITGKGVSTASDATFQQMATNINSIQVERDPSNWNFATCTIIKFTSRDFGRGFSLPNGLKWKDVKGLFGTGNAGMGYGYAAYCITPQDHNRIIRYGSSTKGHGYSQQFTVNPEDTSILLYSDTSNPDGTIDSVTITY